MDRGWWRGVIDRVGWRLWLEVADSIGGDIGRHPDGFLPGSGLSGCEGGVIGWSLWFILSHSSRPRIGLKVGNMIFLTRCINFRKAIFFSNNNKILINFSHGGIS